MTIEELIAQAESGLTAQFARIDRMEEIGTRRVLDAFREHQVAYRHFAPTTGYGYDDVGRDTLEKIFAELFGTQAAIVRPQIASGTHAISLCLFGLVLPGDDIVSATGMPYDTLQDIIGWGEGDAPVGSLREMGVSFHPVALRGGKIDLDAVENAITPKTKLVIAQRSRGYDWRPSLMPEEFAPLAKMLHEKHPGVRLMVDNCYGEFVCEKEPSHYGADVCVGSLIKNPGGGLAPTGGYIVGYIPMVALAGFLMSKSDKWWLHLLAMVAGEVVLYLIGTVWFCVQAGKTASAALAICVYPFIPLDIVKMVIVVLIGPMISSRLKKAHLNV
jgi:cystathionine beta-lyase family protein involved in aluminum resistance